MGIGKERSLILVFLAMLVPFSTGEKGLEIKDMSRYAFFPPGETVPLDMIGRVLIENYGDDIRMGFQAVGYADVSDAFLDRVKGKRTKTSALAAGETLAWMLYRRDGSVAVLKDIIWAGAYPIETVSVEVEIYEKQYEFVILYPYGNIALKQTTTAVSLEHKKEYPEHPEYKKAKKTEEQVKDGMPTFCPPQPSSSYEIERRMLIPEAGRASFGDVSKRITKALKEPPFQYPEIRYYALPYGGFAIVTRIEQFNADGTPKEAGRWTIAYIPPKKLTISTILQCLFRAKKGYFRIIVFLITDKINPFCGDEPVGMNIAIGWLGGGGVRLPQIIADQEFGPSHYCLALIYEFEKPGDNEPGVYIMPSSRGAAEHLNKSKILEKLGAER